MFSKCPLQIPSQQFIRDVPGNKLVFFLIFKLISLISFYSIAPYLLLYVCIYGTGACTQGLMLARQVLYHLSHSCFVLGFFRDRVSQTTILLNS
jgi:hypothetical protein